MGILRWQWTLANGGVVTAVVDTERAVETVSQGERLLAEAPRGTCLDGHTVLVQPEREADRSERPPMEAVVTFDPRSPICILRVDGHDIAPSVWPVRQKPPTPAPPRPWGSYVLLALFVATLLVGGVLLATWRRNLTPPPKPAGKLAGTHRSMNGLFIAHFPEDLEAKLAVLPNGVAGVLLEDKEKSIAIVIAAMQAESVPIQDPWAIQQRLRDEALANVPKGVARFEESSRRDETCGSEHGAVVTGNLAYKGSRRARVWSCAFIHDGAGYLALYTLNEPASAAAERRVRGIIDATELTHLADLGALPEPPAAVDPR